MAFRPLATIRSLLRAAPAAFRRDPLFRYAAIGAVASFLVLLARLGGGDPPAGADPVPPPAPAALGSSYGASQPSSPPLSGPPASSEPTPIAPGRSLDGVRVTPRGSPADRFGTVPASPRSSP